MAADRTPHWLLAAGLVAGIVMAASGVLRPDESQLPPQVIARVNDRLILRDTWLRAVASVSSERRAPLTEADKRHILERLIDEELLVQHGLALGLAEQDRRLRNQLVQQVIQTAIASNAGRPFSDTELHAFYKDHQDFFTPPARIRLLAQYIDAGGKTREFVPPIPDSLLPPAKLRAYLGPTLTEAALRMPVGQKSAPMAHGDGTVILEVLEREAGQAPAFEQLRDQVQAEMQRRADEQAVRNLLQRLRDSHAVVIADDLE